MKGGKDRARIRMCRSKYLNNVVVRYREGHEGPKSKHWN